MRFRPKALLVATAAVMAAGCDYVKRPDFDAHVAKYQGLRDALVQWSGDVKDWETKTANVICDIINTTKADYTYDPLTIQYCTPDTEGDGTPPEPPEFGDF